MGVHVEREARLHPHLPLQPGHWAQSWSPRQTAPPEQGNMDFCVIILFVSRPKTKKGFEKPNIILFLQKQ